MDKEESEAFSRCYEILIVLCCEEKGTKNEDDIFIFLLKKVAYFMNIRKRIRHEDR